MRMSICLNAEAEEYRMFRVSFPDYFAAHCGLEFDASPADLRQWREEINRFLNAREIAKQVRGKLRANHVTQRELADSVGMSEQALSNKLRGLKNFTLRDVSRIADYFDVSVDSLLGREPLEVA